ncbi:MAG TPA: PTS sugar transporter subunit IIA [Candidatus Eisenbacteria bacterium]|nr:PTS sugar transporter subunit IIA [Candidatus Eisenbacteria bacterium]
MPFVSQLRADHIAVNPPWRTFGDAVDGLLQKLVDAGSLTAAERKDAASAIRAREAEASTAVLETGVGVPHARIAALSAPVVALAIATAGLYEAAPTVPIRIVALVLSPVTSLEEHLRTLADIATLLRSSELRAALLRSSDAPAALAILMQYARGLP